MSKIQKETPLTKSPEYAATSLEQRLRYSCFRAIFTNFFTSGPLILNLRKDTRDYCNMSKYGVFPFSIFSYLVWL